MTLLEIVVLTHSLTHTSRLYCITQGEVKTWALRWTGVFLLGGAEIKGERKGEGLGGNGGRREEEEEESGGAAQIELSSWTCHSSSFSFMQ